MLLRLAVCLLAAGIIWLAMGGWAPPFPFRLGDTPPRDIVARTPFSVVDQYKTQQRRRDARADATCVYQHDKQELVELRSELKADIVRILNLDPTAELDEESRQTWSSFVGQAGLEAGTKTAPLLQQFQTTVSQEEGLARFEQAVESVFVDFERDGLLQAPQHDRTDGNQWSIRVHDVGKEEFTRALNITEVQISEAMTGLESRLVTAFSEGGVPTEHAEMLGRLTFHWIQQRGLPVTLELNDTASERARQEAENQQPDATEEYPVGKKLAEGGRPLTNPELSLLRTEHDARVAAMTWSDKVGYLVADWSLYLALLVPCGAFLYFREPRLVTDMRRLATLLAFAVLTVTVCAFDHSFQWRIGLIPLIIFGATMAIAYSRELALLLSTAVALLVTLSLGLQVGDFVVAVTAIVAYVLLIGRIRSRPKLIYLGLVSGGVTFLTAVAVGSLVEQTFGWSGIGHTPLGQLDAFLEDSFTLRLLLGAVWLGFCCVVAGVLMTGLLPFIEKLFEVQTDLSLLELGDASHPLLQQLLQRAPGTYNHSITVASIGEPAADGIGANGLLVRVGAYFHDIGKMLKPDYFVENQVSESNRHDSLMPAMSTLVIIAHVKDGADLARQHRLPQPIIDFIEQHHGTTLVEYFYRQAARQCEEDADAKDLDENAFRYPGPKPQTLEAAVLMMADVAESACRSLVDPAPARIRHLISELAMNRLLDGQFDDCGLTLCQLRVIEESLIKSLTSVYHGRVKYPNQQTA
jgi:putative nucleotidyltransferase with HDIG domain